MSKILDRRAVALQKKAHFPKDFLEFAKFQNTLLFLSTLRMYVQCSRVVGCKLYSCNSNKRELHYIFFSDNFRKFLMQPFQNTLINSSVMEFSRVLDQTPQSWFIFKDDSTKDNSLTFLDPKLSLLKICDGCLFWQQPAIFVKIDLSIDVVLQVIVKNIMFKARRYGLQFQ